MIFEKGANLECVVDGFTPIAHAVYHSAENCVEFLLMQGADYSNACDPREAKPAWEHASTSSQAVLRKFFQKVRATVIEVCPWILPNILETVTAFLGQPHELSKRDLKTSLKRARLTLRTTSHKKTA